MKTKVYAYLPEEAKMIRESVFVQEQGFKNEFDDIDRIAKHIMIFESLKPMATCRIYYSNQRRCYVLGRIAVLKEYREKKLGSALLKAAEEEIIGNKIELLAQERAAAFYEKNGYKKLDEHELDEGCPHVWMRKEI